MKCPACKNELSQLSAKGISLDECENCKGAWFDRDELRKLKDKTDSDLRWLDFDVFAETAEKFKTGSEGRQCPKCGEMMSSLAYEKSGVVIDKCGKCHGVWLDSGEFEKIIRYLEDTVAGESFADYKTDAKKQFKEIFTGQESTVSEIKDFLAILHLSEMRMFVEHPRALDVLRNLEVRLPLR